MDRRQRRSEIAALKARLSGSDYAVIKTLEGLLNCTSVTGMLAYIKTMAGEVAELRAKRQAWRDEINAIEAEVAAMGDASPVKALSGMMDEAAQSAASASHD